MTITELVTMAERIHDAENWDLGSASTRDTRNAFWARVIGCAYHGHAVYNPTPDRQWHLKRADAGRPQTDDVATTMPSRWHWDCIPGAGADGYSFAATSHGVLPAEQIVYAPPIPDGSGTPVPEPPAPIVQPYPDETPVTGWWDAVFTPAVRELYEEAGKVYPDNDRAFRWASRTSYDIRDGMTKEASLAKHLAELEQELGL